MDAAFSDGSLDAGSDVGSSDGGDAGTSDAGSADAAPDGSICPDDCLPPENASLSCTAGTCDFECDAGWIRRDDECIEELTCAPGLVSDAVRVTVDGNRHNSPAIAVSGDTLAVFWIQGSIGANTRAVQARFYDYPAMTPRTDVQIVESGALDRTDRIEVVPTPTGFAVLYNRVDSTFGGSRCALYLYDHDGVRSVGSFNASGGDCRNHAFAGSADGFAMTYWASRLSARRFDTEGRLVAGAPATTISPEGGGGSSNHIVWHSSREDYRIAFGLFDDSTRTASLRTATLSPAGFVTSDSLVIDGLERVSHAEIVTAGGGYGLLYRGRLADTDPNERWVQILDVDGGVVGVSRSLGASTRAALGGGPHEVAVALGNGGDIEVRIHDLTGELVGAPINVAMGPSDADWPDIAWAGDGFVLAYNDDIAGVGLDDIYISRVCPAR